MRGVAPGVDAGLILATKLHAPSIREVVVRRERLLRQLDAMRRPALTLVSAPAGFGKTTLLASWAGADDRPTAWLSLDAGDNDPTRFWLHVLAALHEAGEPASSSLAKLEAGGAGHELPVELLNELTAAGHELVILLDDYHLIVSPQIHESVGFFVEHLPANVRFVIGSRIDPPLPLARLRARGELAEIRASDLRFNPAETAEYLNGSMELGLADGAIDRLDSRTEGWIAALQLAALSLQGRSDAEGFIESFSGDDRFVVDYLAEEVLDRQAASVRDFLLRTSILERLGGSLCDAVTETSGGKAMLESLERANLFVVALDDQRRWYRYHHLFADVLRAHLVDERPDLVDELHRRASGWYSGHGNPAEAVGHALLGHDHELAARLAELAAPDMRQSRQEATLRRWLEALPADLLANRPVLSISLVGARMATGDSTGVEAILDRVEQVLDMSDVGSVVVFDNVEYERLPAQTAIYRAGLALLAGDNDATVAHARRAQELAGAADHVPLGSAAALIALAQWARGELVDAERSYASAIDHLREAGHISDVLGCSLAVADVQLARGLLGEAVVTYDSALQLADQHGGLRGSADMHVGMATVMIERNELDEAARRLDLATALGGQAGLPQNAYRRRVAAAQLAVAQADFDAAIRALADAATYYDTDFSPPAQPVAARTARVQLLRGDLDAARRWVRQAQVGCDDQLSYVREFEHLTLARTLLAAHHLERDARALDDALVLLDRLRTAAESGGRTAIESLVLLAAAHLGRGDQAEAAAALERSLTLAEPEGHVRVFLDVVPSVEPLLRPMKLSDATGRHRDRIVAAAGAAPPRPAASGLVTELSGRERDVLRLLRSDLSGPEIARELHVSLNTLRTHTKSIYTKLGATNRREAVRIAAERGL